MSVLLLPTSEANISYAASLLQSGALVAFPTETVYGIGADARDGQAVSRIFELKGRPADNPVIVHVAHVSLIHTVASSIPKRAKALYHLWPGPLTVIFPAKKSIAPQVTAHTGKVGVRIPAHPVALSLLKKVGIPIAAPSANLSGKPSSTTAQHVHHDFFHSAILSAILDGGACEVGIESTVVDITGPTVLILRPGAITKAQLEHALQEPVEYAPVRAQNPISPGMKYPHYKPAARVRLMTEDQALQADIPSDCWILSVTDHPSLPIHEKLTEQNMYALFRESDEAGVREIIVLETQQLFKHVGLFNRIQKAAE